MEESTSPARRTYRYLRVSIVALVLLLAVSVVIQTAQGGLLGSISAYYYTPSRNVFVGSLVAIAVALIALSGRHVIEDLLLNLAGMLVPLIAFVPTPLPAGDDLGTGVAFDCGDAAACVPAAYVPAIDNNMASLLIVGVLAVVATVVFVLIDRSATRAVVIGICIAAALVVVVGAWFLFGRESFLAFAHFAAAFVFFVLIAAIAVFNAVVLNVDRRRHVLPVAGFSRSTYATAYIVIAGLLVLAVLAMGVLLILQVTGVLPYGAPGFPWFFVVEAAALVFFVAFWTLQTIEKWNDDSSVRAAL